MKKIDAIISVYELTTLISPTDDVLELLSDLEFQRVLELMKIMRVSGRVRSPYNFLKRAIEEGWTPETTAKNIDRKLQRMTEHSYIKRGYSEEESRKMAYEKLIDISEN